MKFTFKYLTIILLTFLMISCEEANQGDNARPILNYGFSAQIANFDIPVTNPVYKIVVFATETSSVDRTVTISKNQDGSHAMSANDIINPPTSVLIPAGALSGSSDVIFDLSNLSIGTSRHIVFDLVTPTDGTVNLTASKIRINYTPECLDTKVQLKLNLDTYPEETGWNIKKDGVIVASKPYNTYAGMANTSRTETLCLSTGSYTITVLDAWGDGISGSSPFTVSVVGGATLISNVPFPSTNSSNQAVPSSITRNFTIN